MKHTPLHTTHTALNAKMAEFAGYDMPIQYAEGVMAEHHWTRNHAGLFDVSHMGQIILEGSEATALLEKLTPSAFSKLPAGVAKYSVLMNEGGGIIDDLIATRISDNKFFVVVNAGCKDKDIAWIQSHLTSGVTMTVLGDRALIAVQGPAAEQVLKESLDIDTSHLGYMRYMEWLPCWISRLGYTGEDGFEISMPAEDARTAWEKLSSHPDIKPVGLAARDSLRLEMGYPLYGHDIDDITSPLEADIEWIMNKRDKLDFIGSRRIMMERAHGTSRKRIGVKLTAPGVAREGTEIFNGMSGVKIGIMTSGGFSPTLNTAIGMAYVDTDTATVGTKVMARVRGRDIPAELCALPFVPAKTKMNKKKVT